MNLLKLALVHCSEELRCQVQWHPCVAQRAWYTTLPWRCCWEGLGRRPGSDLQTCISAFIHSFHHHHPPLVEIKTWGSGPEIFQGRLLGGPWRYVLSKLFQLARAITWLFHFNMRLPRKLAQMWPSPLRAKGSVAYNPKSYTLNPQP